MSNLIPKTFHRVWVGPKEIPAIYEEYWRGWQAKHPDYNFITWRDQDNIKYGTTIDTLTASPPVVYNQDVRNIISERNKEAWADAQHYSEQSDIARYEIIRQFGGIYVDSDFECLRSIDSLLFGVTNFCAQLEWNRLAVGIIGATKDHPLYRCLVGNIAPNFKPSDESIFAGPMYYTEMVKAWQKHERLNDLTVFGRNLFYPYHWDEMDKQDNEFPNSYAVHRWFVSYRKPEYQKNS
jgi:inositol phosphorylceramide mannosyltransferase catalytic subunit